jgi:hypothetical protein
LDKNATPLSDQDAGYWMLDTGLTRYSVDFINRRRTTRGTRDGATEAPALRERLLFPASSNQDPDCRIFAQSIYSKGANAIFQKWIIMAVIISKKFEFRTF